MRPDRHQPLLAGLDLGEPTFHLLELGAEVLVAEGAEPELDPVEQNQRNDPVRRPGDRRPQHPDRNARDAEAELGELAVADEHLVQRDRLEVGRRAAGELRRGGVGVDDAIGVGVHQQHRHRELLQAAVRGVGERCWSAWYHRVTSDYMGFAMRHGTGEGTG